MASVPTFVRSVVIAAPIDRVFAFHERRDALERLSPPFPPLTVIQRTGGISTDARVHIRIGPVHWHAIHTEFDPPRLFVDEQERGPFRRWVHRHEFEDLGAGRTRLTDRLEFELPGGRVVNRLLAPFVRLGLGQMFAYRHKVTVARLRLPSTDERS
jgi:ligand-binding SRPBCC domain-containing protein